MRRLCSALLPLCVLAACVPPPETASVPAPVSDPEAVQAAPRPRAVLRAGEFPLWFQLSGEGPVLLESIEDARFAAALIPWPLAPHIRGILPRKNGLAMAVNRCGFLWFAPWNDGSLGLYYLPGGDFWERYTVGAFVLIAEKPAALLYRNDWFLDTGDALPWPRIWTFEDNSAAPEALELSALDQFPSSEGWDADTLRFGSDGFWYYRFTKKNGTWPEILMLRSASLAIPGETVSLGAFQNSARPEPLGAAPAPLRELLAAVAGSAFALVVSPNFPQPRLFAGSGQTGSSTLAWYYGGPEQTAALAVLPDGRGMRLARPGMPEPRGFSLPPLPEGFVYTGIGLAAGTLIAAWEEQQDFNIGAAGFMVIQMPPAE